MNARLYQMTLKAMAREKEEEECVAMAVQEWTSKASAIVSSGSGLLNPSFFLSFPLTLALTA